MFGFGKNTDVHRQSEISVANYPLISDDEMEKEMEEFLSNESFGTPDQVINARCAELSDCMRTSTEEMTKNTVRIADLSGKNIARDMLARSGQKFMNSFEKIDDISVIEKVVENVSKSVEIASDELKRDTQEIYRLEARNEKMKALIDACNVFVKGFAVGKVSASDGLELVNPLPPATVPNVGEGPDGATGAGK